MKVATVLAGSILVFLCICSTLSKTEPIGLEKRSAPLYELESTLTSRIKQELEAIEADFAAIPQNRITRQALNSTDLGNGQIVNGLTQIARFFLRVFLIIPKSLLGVAIFGLDTIGRIVSGFSNGIAVVLRNVLNFLNSIAQ